MTGIHMGLKKSFKIGSGILILFVLGYLLFGLPMQQLKITAATTADTFNLSGTTDIYCLTPIEAGENHTAVIRFMAVKNRSSSLFTKFGHGSYVQLGCSELKAECGFLSMGRFLRIRLALYANEEELKLEDGTPFDRTRYSLKPVLSVE